MAWRNVLWAAVAVGISATTTAAAWPRDRASAAAAPRIVGYGVVQQTFALPAYAQVRRKVTCPGTKVPIGGGVKITPGSLARFLNSSYPQGRGWAVVVNNNDATAASFTVYALCARKPNGYAVVAGAVSSQPAGFGSADLACPAGKMPLGGGAKVSVPSSAVGLTASLPLDHAWTWAVQNRGATSVSFRPYAVCSSVPVVINYNNTIDNPPGQQSTGTQGCATRVVGGGVAPGDSGTEPEQTIGSTYPQGLAEWVASENNFGSNSQFVVVAAICASV